MLFNHHYPYTNFHELNLEWLLCQIKSIRKIVDEFTLTNQIRYMGEWDISKGYPESSIVVYDDSGYIAIQPVPVGIDINNPDYWVKIANFTQEIANIGADLEELRSYAEGNITYLNNAINSQTELIRQRQKMLNSSAKCLLIGNSFARGTGSTGNNLGWSHYFQQNTGATCYTILQNGGDFLATGNSNADYPNKTYREAFNTWAENNRSSLPLIDFIIFGGCANDHNYDQSEIWPEVVTTVNRCRELCPNAQIYIFPMTQRRYINNSEALSGIVQAVYGWIHGASLSKSGGCDTYKFIGGHASMWADDTTHLNEFGYQRLAQFMAAYINGTESDIICQPLDDYIVLGENVTLYSGSNRNKLTRYGMTVEYEGGYTISDGIENNFTVATLPSPYRPAVTYYTMGYLTSTEPSTTLKLIPIEINSNGQIIIRRNTDAEPYSTSGNLYIHTTHLIG